MRRQQARRLGGRSHARAKHTQDPDIRRAAHWRGPRSVPRPPASGNARHDQGRCRVRRPVPDSFDDEQHDGVACAPGGQAQVACRASACGLGKTQLVSMNPRVADLSAPRWAQKHPPRPVRPRTCSSRCLLEPAIGVDTAITPVRRRPVDQVSTGPSGRLHVERTFWTRGDYRFSLTSLDRWVPQAPPGSRPRTPWNPGG